MQPFNDTFGTVVSLGSYTYDVPYDDSIPEQNLLIPAPEVISNGDNSYIGLSFERDENATFSHYRIPYFLRN